MRPRDRLTSFALAGSVVSILCLSGGALAQQATGAQPSRDQDQRELTECDTSRDPAQVIRSCSAVLNRVGTNAPTAATRGFVLHKRANAFRERGEFALSVADYTEVIGLDGTDANAHYNRANVHLLRNDHVAALADYRKAVELRPGLRVAHVQLGTLLLARNDPRGALDHFDRAVRIDGRDAGALAGRGIARDRLGDLDGAIASLDEAIVQSPDLASVRFMRAQLLRRKGDNSRALAELDRVLASTPDDADALIERGTIQNALGNRDRAIADCGRVIDRNNTNASAYVCRGLARAGRGELRTARVDLDRAVQLDGTQPEALAARGYLLYQIGAMDEAIADFRRALVLDPASGDAQRFLGVALIDKGDVDTGMKVLDDAIRSAPNDPWPHMLRAVGLAGTGNRDGALRDVASAIRILGDRNSNARLARGVVYYHLNELDKVRADIDAAIQLDGTNGQAYNALGRLLIRQRDFDRARDALDTALRLLPGHWVVLRNRALAALERGDMAGARRDIAASLDINGAFAESFVVRGRLNEADSRPELAIADYELALARLPLDRDGHLAQQHARERLAALRGADASPGVSPSGSPATRIASDETATSRAPSESLHCRLLRAWAGHAEGYSGVKLYKLAPSCSPK